ncbi:hypothetical protein FRC03_011736 [Tulasnella sp. 419]|nr:hypothetical protein FRC03_011736 [Tulasnella sp. 419]
MKAPKIRWTSTGEEGDSLRHDRRRAAKQLEEQRKQDRARRLGGYEVGPDYRIMNNVNNLNITSWEPPHPRIAVKGSLNQ